MRAYWDDGARRNAAWYVDTTLSYEEPDMVRFLAGGQHIVTELFDRVPVEPAGRGLAVEMARDSVGSVSRWRTASSA